MRSIEPRSEALEMDRMADLDDNTVRGGTPTNPADEREFVLDPDLTLPPEWSTRAGSRTLGAKLSAGVSGLKFAMRGDSSFFAHAYRGLLIVLTAGLLGVTPMAWCLLVQAIVLVLIAELSHSAIDTLARSLGDPDELGLRVAREIANAGVLVAVIALVMVALTIFTLRLNELFGWW